MKAKLMLLSISPILLFTQCQGENVSPQSIDNIPIVQKLTFEIDTTTTQNNWLLRKAISYVDTMFTSLLDHEGKKTLIPVSYVHSTSDIPEMKGFRLSDRAIDGINLWHDQDLYRLSVLVDEISDDDYYLDKTQQILGQYLQGFVNHQTGFYPWGEHKFYNYKLDIDEGLDWHEFFQPMLLTDVFNSSNANQWYKYSQSVWNSQIADKSSGFFSRHAKYSSYGPMEGDEFPRHGGFMIRLWAEEYLTTSDDSFLKYMKTLLEMYLRRYYQNGYIPYSGKKIDQERPYSNLTLYYSILYSRKLVDSELFDELIKVLQINVINRFNDPRAYIKSINHEMINPSFTLEDYHDGYSAISKAKLSILLGQCYLLSGNPKFKELSKTYMLSYSDESLQFPESYTDLIWGNILLSHITNDRSYSQKALEFSIKSRDLFFGPHAIPQASVNSAHYESISGGPTLALSYLYLWIEINYPGQLFLEYSRY